MSFFKYLGLIIILSLTSIACDKARKESKRGDSEKKSLGLDEKIGHGASDVDLDSDKDDSVNFLRRRGRL